MDLTQETFTRVFSRLDTLRDPDRFTGWLFAIAANVCRTQLSRAGRARELVDAFALEQDRHVQADDARARERRIALVQRLLAKIEDRTLRKIVNLKYAEPEHTTRQIAAQLDIPHGTVTVKLSRFRAAVRRDLARALLEVS